MAYVQSLGRFQVIVNSSPPALPGKCVVCGTTSRDISYVDFGFDLDFYGVVYFCSNCITEVAMLLNYIPPAQWQELTDSLGDVVAENTELQQRNGELKHAIDSLSRLISAGSVTVTVDVEDVADTEQQPEDTGAATIEPNAEYSYAESGSIESNNEPGSTDIQYDDSIIDKLISEI